MGVLVSGNEMRQSRKKYSRRRELSFQQLLNTKICDLELRPEDTLRSCLIELRHELRRRDIAFFPRFYFGQEPWGCINRTGSVEVPFYLANGELRRIAEKYYISYSKKEIMMILRHEVGHAILYAYKLWIRSDWKSHFGNFRAPYRHFYHYNPSSREYVRYLHHIGNPHYAQKHPDEDFAETFAVWLDPDSKWSWNYRSWEGALEKLRFVEQLFANEHLAVRRPLRVRYDETGSYRAIESTVAEYFEIERKVDPHYREYIQDMKEIFPKGKGSPPRRSIRADLFLQNYAEYLEDELVNWIAGADRRDVRKFLRDIQTICSLNNLHLQSSQAAEKLVELVIVSTYHILSQLRLIK
jgi:hypothetical protein